MNNERTKPLIKFAIVVVLLLICVISNCVRSKAENEIPQIPVPSGSWEDYQSAHPILTPEPTPTAEPTETSRPERPLLGATQTYHRSQLRMYRAYMEPTIPPPATQYYQYLTSPYNTSSTIPGNAAVEGTSTAASLGVPYYVYNSNNRTGGSPVLNASDSTINMLESYIGFEWLFRYTQTTTITQGLGLDYGKETHFTLQYDVHAFNKDTGELFDEMPVKVICQMYWDSGYMASYDYNYTLTDLQKGLAFKCPSDVSGWKLFFCKFYVLIGMDETMYRNLKPDTRAGNPLYQLFSNGGFIVNAFTQDRPATNNDIVNTIVANFNNLPGFFVPTEQETTAWIQSKLADADASGNPVTIAYTGLLQLLSDIYNGEEDDFTIKIPTLRIRVNGVNYAYFNGINYDFDDADIPLEGQEHTLFYYSRLIGDCIIVVGFVFNYLRGLWKKIYDASFAGGE